MEVLEELARRLNPAHLLEDSGPVESTAYSGLAILLALATLAGLLLSLRPHLVAGANHFHEQLARRYGGWLAWLGGAGLLAIGLRYTSAPFFSKRIWLLLDLVGLAAIFAHLAWYRFARYRLELARSEEERRRRVRPATRPRRGRPPVRRR